MKKIPILLTSALILATIISAPTHALYVDNDEAAWYTVPELLEYGEEFEREKQEICGEDFWCQEEYFYNNIESEPKLSALDQFLQQQFVLTAANPGEGYIKVMFFGEDMMLSRMGIHEEIGIEQVYVGWFEDNSERIFYLGMNYDEFVSGEIDGLHTIYAWRADSPEENLINSNEEIVLEASDLVNNTSGQLVYFVDSGEGRFNAIGRLIYTNCLSESDYRVGAECKLMTSAEKGQAYYPPRETTLKNDDTKDLATVDDGDTGGLMGVYSADNITDVSDLVNEDNDAASDDIVTSNDDAITNDDGGERGTIIDTNTDIDLFGAPDTGANTIPCGQKVVEFPWWLVALIALGDAIIMWLFWPNQKRIQKSR